MSYPYELQAATALRLSAQRHTGIAQTLFVVCIVQAEEDMGKTKDMRGEAAGKND